MIPDHVDRQNEAKRRELAAAGYTISIGSDGWHVLKMSDEVARGFPERGLVGEARRRACLDAAVRKADVLYRESLPKPEPEREAARPREGDSLQRKATLQAVSFLKLSGARYRVELEGEVFTNIEEKLKEKRQPAAAIYKPHFAAHAGEDSFIVKVPVPEDMDFDKFAWTMEQYMRTNYGTGNFVQDVKKSERLIEAMISKGIK